MSTDQKLEEYAKKYEPEAYQVVQRSLAKAGFAKIKPIESSNSPEPTQEEKIGMALHALKKGLDEKGLIDPAVMGQLVSNVAKEAGYDRDQTRYLTRQVNDALYQRDPEPNKPGVQQEAPQQQAPARETKKEEPKPDLKINQAALTLSKNMDALIQDGMKQAEADNGKNAADRADFQKAALAMDKLQGDMLLYAKRQGMGPPKLEKLETDIKAHLDEVPPGYKAIALSYLKEATHSDHIVLNGAYQEQVKQMHDKASPHSKPVPLKEDMAKTAPPAKEEFKAAAQGGIDERYLISADPKSPEFIKDKNDPNLATKVSNVAQGIYASLDKSGGIPAGKIDFVIKQFEQFDKGMPQNMQYSALLKNIKDGKVPEAEFGNKLNGVMQARFNATKPAPDAPKTKEDIKKEFQKEFKDKLKEVTDVIDQGKKDARQGKTPTNLPDNIKLAQAVNVLGSGPSDRLDDKFIKMPDGKMHVMWMVKNGDDYDYVLKTPQELKTEITAQMDEISKSDPFNQSKYEFAELALKSIDEMIEKMNDPKTASMALQIKGELKSDLSNAKDVIGGGGYMAERNKAALEAAILRTQKVDEQVIEVIEPRSGYAKLPGLGS